MLPDGCKILTYFSCIDKNFFVPMRDARGYRTRQALKKHLYAPIGALLTNYSFKPIGAYKCFLKPDVYDNLWHPASEQKNFCQYMKNMLKFCSHPEALKTNFIEYV